MEIFLHADDYGISVVQSKKILDCIEYGLNSVSIMPNSQCLEQVIELLPQEMYKSIHLNLVEGKCCADPKKIPLLVDENGIFKNSPQRIWILTLLERNKMKKQLQIEIDAQVKNVLSYLPSNYKVRIDSHMHTHMIPTVFDVVCNMFGDTPQKLEYIRWSVENIYPICGDFKACAKIPNINIIKQMLIGLWGMIDRRYLKKYHLEDKIGMFWGVMYSGQMFGEHVEHVAKKYVKLAKSKDESLEILFHPGGLQSDENIPTGINGGGLKFYLSDNREKEKQEIEKIYNYIK